MRITAHVAGVVMVAVLAGTAVAAQTTAPTAPTPPRRVRPNPPPAQVTVRDQSGKPLDDAPPAAARRSCRAFARRHGRDSLRRCGRRSSASPRRLHSPYARVPECHPARDPARRRASWEEPDDGAVHIIRGALPLVVVT